MTNADPRVARAAKDFLRQHRDAQAGDLAVHLFDRFLHDDVTVRLWDAIALFRHYRVKA